jgi:hypothetical protein
MMSDDAPDVIQPLEGSDPTFVEQAETEELMMTDTVRFPKTLPAQVIQSLQGDALEALQLKDKELVEKGMNLFFRNQFKEAETLFAAHYCQDSLVASAYGTLGTIRALLSMEQVDVDEACQRLLFASSFALQVSPPERVMTKTIAAVSNTVSSALSKASGLFGRWGSKNNAVGDSAGTPTEVPSSPATTNKNTLSAAQFRAEVVHAESEVLRATLLLLQDSFSSIVKAGLALRRSYNTYARLEQYMLQHHSDDGAGLDRNSVYGVHFGLGCIHVVTSILPPKILAVLKALGYMHNRDVGFQHLQKCLESNTLRSPLASLFMLAFHGMLPSFALVMIPESLPICNGVVAHNAKEYPVSVIHLWVTGRVARLSKDTAQSMNVLEQCLANGKHLQEDLPQLQHFALYDQAMNWCMVKDWLSAATAYRNLENESNWSKMFFSYAEGCCYEMIALAKTLDGSHRAFVEAVVKDAAVLEGSETAESWWAKASDAYRRSQSHQPTRLGGKVISIDQFVIRRLNTMMERQGGTPEGARLRNVVPLPGLELLLIFYMMHQTPSAMLQPMAAAIQFLLPAMIARDQGVPRSACNELLSTVCSDYREDVEAALLGPGVLLPAYNGESAVMLLMLAGCIRDGGGVTLSALCGGHRVAADKIYSALVDGNLFPRSAKGIEEIKWCAPFAFYERAICRYSQRLEDDAASACKALQVELDAFRGAFGRSDYHFEMQMQFRLHLTSDFLRRQEQTL